MTDKQAIGLALAMFAKPFFQAGFRKIGSLWRKYKRDDRAATEV